MLLFPSLEFVADCISLDDDDQSLEVNMTFEGASTAPNDGKRGGSYVLVAPFAANRLKIRQMAVLSLCEDREGRQVCAF